MLGIGYLVEIKEKSFTLILYIYIYIYILYICGVECENQEFGIKDKYCVFSSEMWYKLPISMKVIL